MKIVRTTARGRNGAETQLRALEKRGRVNTARVQTVVRGIMNAVAKRGDKALLQYARKFDGLSGNQPLRVTQQEMAAAWESTPRALRTALETAAKNIRGFAERQKPKEWNIEQTAGVTTGQMVRSLASVGCYVPGGRYPLPSTLLMTVLPARVAGVKKITVVSPKPARETLAAAYLAGVENFYRIGGAQAIAALAYGTEAIAAVDKIVGPGNLYVTAAKELASTICGIDMPAGPTEIVVTSETGNPQWIAADLVAQAEHDPDALAIFVTSNADLAKSVAAEVKLQAKTNPIAKRALAKSGTIFITRTIEEAREITNRLAPEHLTVDTPEDLAWVRNAGSVFVGALTPQTMGDYISGPNHVLPTGRVGRVRGGLSVLDFVKIITVQQYTPVGLADLGPQAIALAEAEGLSGHAESVRVRLK
jgi:histidinol dehydrogenase